MDFRRLNEKDGDQFLKLLLNLDHETQFMVYEPGERQSTGDEMAQRIASTVASGAIFAAEQEGELVGFVSANRYPQNRINHIVYLVVGVLQKASGQGVATQLLKNCEAWSREVGVKRLELSVVCHNQRAFELYQRMGFEVEGTKKAAIRIDGAFYDEYYMCKILT